MIGQSILRSDTISSVIMFREELWHWALQYISTNEQVADILTKSLGRGKFIHFRDKLGVVENKFLVKREC